MKRPSYKHAIEWIALNDDPGCTFALDVNNVSDLISVILIADIFGIDRKKVAQDVIRVRKKS